MAKIVAVLACGLIAAPGAEAARADHGERAQEPALVWRACGDAGAECATLAVPRDYRRPHGEMLDVAVARARATDPERRIGTLFFNFGGPGAPAAAYVEAFGADLFPTLGDRFDVVGVDPRGTGRSEGAIDCAVDQERRGVYSQPFTTPLNLNVGRLIQTDQRYIGRCLQRNPEILPYVSTSNTARDMDRVRRALGERRLSYLGFSYGTFLGVTYASLFPNSYRALVLDGALDADRYINEPLLSLREQTAGFERAIGRFLAACEGDQAACSGFGGDEPWTAFDELIERADRQPLPAEQGRPVEGDDIRAASAQLVYAKQLWGDLGLALAQGEAGDGTLLRAWTDVFYGRRADGGYDPLLDRYFTIGALEQRYPRRVKTYLRAGDHSWGLFDHAYWNHGYTELAWGLYPVRPRGVFRGPFRASRRGPTVLVVGTTYDPATPYRGSARLARELGNARLLTMRGDGHTAYGGNSACIDEAVDAYLERKVVPAEGTTCRQEVPFTAPQPERARPEARTLAPRRPTLPQVRPHVRPLIRR
ncbi:MAG: alpha/beta hydrolase [Thermoleophilaceae bacterium]